jgi:hypothetical protein
MLCHYLSPLKRRLRVIVISFVIVTSGCNVTLLGDQSHTVIIHNATEQAVRLDDGTTRSSDPSKQRTIQPGQSKEDAWLKPLTSTDPSRIVKAYRQSDGTLIFCKSFAFEELERAGWNIEITADIEC